MTAADDARAALRASSATSARRMLAQPELHPAAEWAAERKVRVLDPDGWRRDGLPWETPITLADYLDREAHSTCEFPVWRPMPVEG